MSSSLATWTDRARRYFGESLWSLEVRPRSLAATAVRVLQLSTMIAQGFVRDRLLLRASALTYMAILSLIPALAVALSVVKAMGVSENLAELVVDQLAAGSPGAKQQILELVEGANLGGLGTVGAFLLILTTVLALRHGEEALNSIWGVTRGRSWGRRFADYLAVLIVAPLLAGVSLSLATMLQSGPVLGYLLELPLFATFYELGLRYAPFLLLTLAFTFVYWFLPNTRVRFVSALLGGVVAALLFGAARYLYVDFNIGVARYNALFGGFAALPLLLVWIYVSAALVLFGAEVSFAHQNLAHYRQELSGGPVAPAQREALALRLSLEVARSFRDGSAAPGAGELADVLDAPVRAVRELLEVLDRSGVISLRADDGADEVYQLGRPAELIRIADVLRAIRGERAPQSEHGGAAGAVAQLLGELDRSVAAVAESRTLADILSTVEPDEAGKAGRPGAWDEPAASRASA